MLLASFVSSYLDKVVYNVILEAVAATYVSKRDPNT